MATSSIKIYKTVLVPEKNAIIEDIAAYLQTLSPTYVANDFQYVQLGLDISIKIKLDQENVGKNTLGNYVAITQDQKIYYYFIMSSNWTSKKVVELKLSIDSLNTFYPNLIWADRTVISREHEDRFVVSSTYNPANADTVTRLINQDSEGIIPLKYQFYNSPVIEDHLNYDWYLIYRTRDDLSPDNYDNPVSCYLCANKELKNSDASSTDSLTYSYGDLRDGMYYYFTVLDNPGGIITNGTLGTTYKQVINVSNISYAPVLGDRIFRGAVIHRVGNQLYVAYSYDNNVGWFVGKAGNTSYGITGPVEPNTTFTNSVSADITPFEPVTSITITKGKLLRFSSTYYAIPDQAYIEATQTISIDVGYADSYIDDFSSLDRTDSKIIKVIKLPYCPVDVQYNATTGRYTFPNTWEKDSTLGFLKLKNDALSEQFLNNVGSLTLPELKCSLPILSTTDTKSMDRESKLYHSDYYIVKMVYDTFYKEIGLEKFKVTIPVTNYSFPLEFKQTNTINSKFIFHANFDYISGVAYQSEIDYDSYLVVGRNNEETVFSSDYINYIRTGYNYDQKAQTLEMQQATSNMVINGLASIASTAATIAGGNVITGAAAISHATQFINGLTSMANSQKNFDNSMSAKLSQLANQSTGVSGADDIDLLSYYNGNRLEIKKYKPRDLMQQALYNLFFYTGYIHNVQAIPSLNSRYWFNFIQCAPHFKNEQTSVYIDYLDDIKARFNSGVTIFHHHTTWDFEQKYENWENSLLNAGGGTPPETYTLTLLYFKDGTEDVSLMDVRSIDKGTEVSPSDYKLDLDGYTYQDSVPNDSFTMNKNNYIQYNYITTPPSTYTLTLIYFKDGTEDVSLMDVRSIDKGTEVSPYDYKLDLDGYTYQDSVPNDSFTMNKNNYIQYNYITTPPSTYTLTLIYFKDGTEDVSLMDVRSIDKGTEVSPYDYKLDLDGYTYQDSVPNDSFTMNKNNYIQYNYITTPPETYTLTLHHYFNGTEDVSLRDTKTIARGTEVSPVDYIIHLDAYKFQSSVPSDSFTMNDNESIQLNYVTRPPTSYTLTLHYYKDGVEDVSLRDTKTIVKGTEVFPVDYKKELSGFTYQDSVPNDSFDMNDNNSIQYNYITTKPTLTPIVLNSATLYSDGTLEVSYTNSNSVNVSGLFYWQGGAYHASETFTTGTHTLTETGVPTNNSSCFVGTISATGYNDGSTSNTLKYTVTTLSTIYVNGASSVSVGGTANIYITDSAGDAISGITVSTGSSTTFSISLVSGAQYQLTGISAGTGTLYLGATGYTSKSVTITTVAAPVVPALDSPVYVREIAGYDRSEDETGFSIVFNNTNDVDVTASITHSGTTYTWHNDASKTITAGSQGFLTITCQGQVQDSGTYVITFTASGYTSSSLSGTFQV